MNLINKTSRPIRVPLPDNKTLHLGPRKSAQITARSAKHPALVALVEAGDLALEDMGRDQAGGSPGTSTSSKLQPPTTGHSGGGAGSNIRRSGDR